MAKLKSGSSPAQRKRRLETKLSSYGIEDTTLPLISSVKAGDAAVDPQRVAQRLLVLLAVSFTAYSFDESDRVMEWLKKEGLWKEAGESEKEFFRSPAPSEEEKALLSWRFEGAYQLASALNVVSAETDPTRECSEEQVAEFFSRAPSVGMPTDAFCSAARLRPEIDIIDEYLFYEKVKTYLDELQSGQKENTSGIHVKASLERLNVLRWLIGFEGKTTWDEIITEEDLF